MSKTKNQSLHFIPAQGYATVFLYDTKEHYGFASPGKTLQEAGVTQSLFFHAKGFVRAHERYRDEVTFMLTDLDKVTESQLTNASIYCPLVYRKDDGRFTARQWTLRPLLHPQLTYVTETIRSDVLGTSESVVFVGTQEQCNHFINANKNYVKGELSLKGRVEPVPF